MLKTTTTFTWILLIILTIVSAFLSDVQAYYVVYIIIGLAGLKFIGVAFEFMELKKAHWAWSVSILSFLTIFTLAVLIML